ncbi:MAG: hypothetical protein IJK43_13915 [Prevotella sp.]|nr:hypothetical protein [Prevotella sp.]
MKKTMMAAAALMLLMMTAVALTGCGSDGDDDNTPKPDDTTPVAAVMDYSLTVGDDMLSLLDLTVEYYDADGKVQTEPLTQKSWKKSVRAKLPATLGARLKMQLKDGADPASLTQFTASYGYNYNGYAVSATDKVVGNIVNSGTDTNLAMQGDKVTTWLEHHTDGLVKFLYNFAANGQATSSNWQ